MKREHTSFGIEMMQKKKLQTKIVIVPLPAHARLLHIHMYNLHISTKCTRKINEKEFKKTKKQSQNEM